MVPVIKVVPFIKQVPTRKGVCLFRGTYVRLASGWIVVEV